MDKTSDRQVAANMNKTKPLLLKICQTIKGTDKFTDDYRAVYRINQKEKVL